MEGENTVAFCWSEEAAREWGERAENWSSRSQLMWESGSRKDVIPFIKKYVQAGGKICDLGCGDGYSTWLLAENGYRMTGIDYSEVMIEKAHAYADDSSLTFIRADMANLPFSDNTFQGMLAINSLEWAESPLIVLNEMKRITKDKGIAVIGILGPTAGPRANSYERLYGEKVICNTMMPWELEKLASENGWEKVAEYGVYKRGVHQQHVNALSTELKQALSFMWVFAFKNNKGAEVTE